MARTLIAFSSIRQFAGAILFLALFNTIIDACECTMRPPVCYEYSQTDAIFIGEVTDVSDDPNIFPVNVKVKVLENFKGMSHPFSNTWDRMTSCSHSYEEGDKLLIFAGLGKQNDSFFSAGLCTRTARLTDIRSDLDYVRAMNEGRSKYTIWATINKFIDSPIEGVEAEVIKPKLNLKAKSDINGDLRIEVAKVGKYILRVWIPKGKMRSTTFGPIDSVSLEQAAMFRSSGRTRKGQYRDFEVEVKENRCGWINVPLMNKTDQ